MKLSQGNYALCIAHPGHELRLHGFLEQARPCVFIFTDGSHRTGQDMMFDSIRAIDKATKQGLKLSMAFLKSAESKKVFKISRHDLPEGEQHLKDPQIYNEVLNQFTDISTYFIHMMAKNFMLYKIDYVIGDASEGTNVCHEVMRILTDVAIALVKKTCGKEIICYDFALDRPFNEKVNDKCIHVELDDAAMYRKIAAIMKYPLGIHDLKPNISLDYTMLLELQKMKDGDVAVKKLLKDANIDFLKNEYLRPYSPSEVTGKPLYELEGEKAVEAGKYYDVITYKKHLKPLKEKLTQTIILDGKV